MPEWKEKVLIGETLKLNGKEEVYYLGTDLQLRDCKLSIRCTGNWFCLSSCKFIGCEIDIRKSFRNISWNQAYLENCVFTGRLIGHDFGCGSGDRLGWKQAGVRNCDFSKASLYGLRFFDVSVDQVTLPAWPMFTILDPTKTLPKLAAAKWPDGMSVRWVEVAIPQPANLSFMVEDAEVMVKLYGGRLDSFRKKLTTFDFIRL